VPSDEIPPALGVVVTANKPKARTIVLEVRIRAPKEAVWRSTSA